jgi:hypothetical protein
LDVIALLIIGVLVERNYTGRMTAFSNSIALNLAMLRLQNLHWILRLYGDIGFMLGLLGLISYVFYIEYAHRYGVDPVDEFPRTLSQRWYDGFWWYNSAIVAIVVLISAQLNQFVQGVPALPIPFI